MKLLRTFPAYSADLVLQSVPTAHVYSIWPQYRRRLVPFYRSLLRSSFGLSCIAGFLFEDGHLHIGSPLSVPWPEICSFEISWLCLSGWLFRPQSWCRCQLQESNQSQFIETSGISNLVFSRLYTFSRSKMTDLFLYGRYRCRVFLTIFIHRYYEKCHRSTLFRRPEKTQPPDIKPIILN